MKIDTDKLPSSSRRLTTLIGLAFLALCFVWVAGACGTDQASEGTSSCETDSDCEIGTVCGSEGECVESPCDFCEDDQICYKTADNPEGVCSAPECYVDDDCDDGQCIDNQCGGPYNVAQPDPCSGPDDCPDGQTCSPGGTCVDEPEPECQNASDCDGPDEICDNGQCVDDGGGNGDCDTDELNCAEPTPYADAQSCSCVECLTATDCGDANKDCQNGQCIDDGGNGPGTPGECTQSCDPNEPGVCNSPTPYCVDECCVECIGSGDCSGTEACIDGFCGDPGACTTDGDCPSGYTCNNGDCEAPATGTGCDPNDPDSCPDTQVCDPDTETCQGVGGDMGCGLCNDDCTCPGISECESSFMCMGCLTAADCPSGTECFFIACF